MLNSGMLCRALHQRVHTLASGFQKVPEVVVVEGFGSIVRFADVNGVLEVLQVAAVPEEYELFRGFGGEGCRGGLGSFYPNSSS